MHLPYCWKHYHIFVFHVGRPMDIKHSKEEVRYYLVQEPRAIARSSMWASPSILQACPAIGSPQKQWREMEYVDFVHDCVPILYVSICRGVLPKTSFDGCIQAITDWGPSSSDGNSATHMGANVMSVASARKSGWSEVYDAMDLSPSSPTRFWIKPYGYVPFEGAQKDGKRRMTMISLHPTRLLAFALEVWVYVCVASWSLSTSEQTSSGQGLVYHFI
eukprot:scaffold5885_cov201-Amphora_coffeaeformis.AAC.15